MFSAAEQAMYALGQLFLLPTQIAVMALFAFALYALGRFAVQAWQRRADGAVGADGADGAARRAATGAQPPPSLEEAELRVARELELLRLVSRTGPMLGLVATMIPLGPALRALADGRLSDMAHGLTTAFSAVILALLAAAITFAIAQVRRRWYAVDRLALERLLAKAPAPAPTDAPVPLVVVKGAPERRA